MIRRGMRSKMLETIRVCVSLCLRFQRRRNSYERRADQPYERR